MKETKDRGNRLKNYIQFSVLLFLATLSLDCLLAHKWSAMIHSKITVGCVVAIINLIAVFMGVVACLEIKKQVKEGNISIKILTDRINDSKYIVLALGLYALFASLSYNTIPLYDSAEYFSEMSYSIDRIRINPLSALDAYSIIGKQMQFFSIVFTPFLVLFRCNPIGIYIMNTGLAIISMLAVYALVKEIFNELDSIACAVISFIFGMFAFIYTGITYVNPDFYCAVFFPIMIYCFLKKYWLFFLYTATVFGGMKSNMLVTYGVLFFILWTVSLYGKRKLDKKLVIEAVFIAIPFIINVYLKFFRTVGKWSQQSTRLEIPLSEEIRARLSQEFIYGFKWLILLLVITIIILRRKKIKKYPMLLLAVPAASIVQIAVYIGLHSTKLSICPRYWAIDALMYSLGVGFIIDNITTKRFRILFMSLFAFVITVQQFWCIDPAMHLLCKSIPFEKRKVFIMVPKNYAESIGIGDSCAFNMQYASWDSIWTDFINDGLITEDTVIYSTVDKEHDDIAYKIRYGVNGLDQIDWYIDASRNAIVYAPNENAHKATIQNLRSTDDVEKLLARGEAKITLFKPDTVSFDPQAELMNSGYYVIDERHYENSYTTLDVIVLKSRNSIDYVASDFYHNDNVVVESDRLVINPGGIVFGPAEPIEIGVYEVVFRGTGLDECVCDAYSNSNWYAVQYSENSRNSNEIRLAVYVNEPVQDIEFRTFNYTSSYFRLDSVRVNRAR